MFGDASPVSPGPEVRGQTNIDEQLAGADLDDRAFEKTLELPQMTGGSMGGGGDQLFETSASFAELLRAERQRRELSQAAMAKMLDVSASSLSGWERGRTPSAEIVRRVRGVLGGAPIEPVNGAAEPGAPEARQQRDRPAAVPPKAAAPRRRTPSDAPVSGQTVLNAFPANFDRNKPNFKRLLSHHLWFRPAPPDATDEAIITAFTWLHTIGALDVERWFLGDRTERARTMRTSALWRGEILIPAVFTNTDGKLRPFAFFLARGGHERAKRMTDPQTGERLVDRKTRHRLPEGKGHHDIVNQALVSSAVLAIADAFADEVVRYEGTPGNSLTVDAGRLTCGHEVPAWFGADVAVRADHLEPANIPVRARLICRGGAEILICRQPHMNPDNDALLEHFPTYDAFLGGWWRKHPRFTGSTPPVIVIPCEDEDHALDLIEAAHTRVTTWTWMRGTNMNTGRSPSRDRLLFVPQTWLDAGNLTGIRLSAIPPTIQDELGGSAAPRNTPLEQIFR